jgi:hypothetical protein
MTNEQLAAQYQHRLNQSAINAAAGTGAGQPSLGLPGDNSGSINQQRYAQMMRAQQVSQSKGNAPLPNGVRAPSRVATPQTPRLPNIQAPPVPSQSPRPPQAPMARGP